MTDDPLRRRTHVEAMTERAECIIRADEIYMRMLIWGSAGFVCGIFTFLFSWMLLFPTLLFAAAWTAAADSREIWLKAARDWQQYMDENEL